MIVAHGALCTDARLWLFDGKRVELGPWAPVADVFVGNDIAHANDCLRPCRRRWTAATRGSQPTAPQDRPAPTRSTSSSCVIDELAFFSVTIGTKEQQEEFSTLVRDLVARGRAAGIIMSSPPNGRRPTSSPPRCGTCSGSGWRSAAPPTPASDIILSVGWAAEGFSAKTIPPDDAYRGVGFLLAEGGIPRRFKAAYLDDDQIDAVIAHALRIRHRPAG